MRTLFAFLLFLIAGSLVFGQKTNKPTSSFTISGEVKASSVVQIADLSKWKAVPIGDVIITNHLGEKKSEAKGLKGVLLREVLSSVEINSESPKILSEYYFVCTANDGYRVVFSWNELFNTSVGDSVFIVTEKEGKPASGMEESILIISPRDFKTGRRHVKSLATVEVKRAK